MLPQPQNKYDIWPAVVPADAVTEMTVVPTGRSFLLFEGKDYTLRIIPVDSDVLSYREPENQTLLTVTAHGGVLRFSHRFEGEQEYTILLEDNEKVKQEMSVYALREDLYALRPLKGDLHAHSFRSDGSTDAAALAGHYREQGYDFFALTDHNRYYPGDEIDQTYEGVHTGLCRVLGEEVHTPGSGVHIVHVGGKRSICARYVCDREGYEKEIDEYESRVPVEVPALYRRRYAMAMWTCDRAHESGGLAVFAHPLWRPGLSRTLNVSNELSQLFLRSGMFDAYELIGGMGQPAVNCSIALWTDLLANGYHIPVVGSSDVHHAHDVENFPGHFTVCFAEANENDAILAAVKNGMSVAVEETGAEYGRRWRCYGSYRLVCYTQFLFKHYFLRMQRVCQGVGIAMRDYAMGEGNATLIEAQQDRTEAFIARFFGRKAPLLPSEEILAFEDGAREAHLAYPLLTKGSFTTAPTITRQI